MRRIGIVFAVVLSAAMFLWGGCGNDAPNRSPTGPPIDSDLMRALTAREQVHHQAALAAVEIGSLRAETGRYASDMDSLLDDMCEAMGDSCPAYLDPEAAKQTVHGGIVAPPAMLQVFDMRGYPMHDPRLLPANKQRELHGVFDAHGYTGVVATDTEQEFRRYLRSGDRITARTRIESISEEKSTALGAGYFVVTRTRFSDQQGEEVGSLSFRVLKFRPKAPAAKEPK